MLYGISNALNRAIFNFQCRRVFDTPAAPLARDSDLAVLTLLQHKDVMMAALAFKSFAQHAPVGAFFIVDDGTLTQRDRGLLKEHLPGVTFLDRAAYVSPHCPTGGCWERLLAIADVSKSRYVIQLDSDTLTLAPIPEVCEAARSNTSFAISTWDDQEIEGMRERQQHAARLVAESDGKAHIQVVAEANFDKLTEFRQLRYLRGCAGFSGFGKGSVDHSFIENISAEMFSALGDRWAEWGSEQVMSNIVVANCPKALPLPHPKYCDCTRMSSEKTVFVHFIGTCRFSANIYAKHASRFLRQKSENPV